MSVHKYLVAVSSSLSFFLLFTPFVLLGQVKESPLKWSYAPSKTEVKIGEEIELIFTATIEDGWYSYSKGPFESAPEASFTFEKNPSYQLIGEIKPIHDKKKIDEFLGEYRYFVGKAEFRQKVKILSENPQIKVVYEYYSCSLESGKCLPPFEEEATFSGFNVVGKIEAPITKPTDTKIILSTTTSKQITNTVSSISAATSKLDTLSDTIPTTTVATERPIVPSNEKQGVLGFMVAAFFAGFAALLTPCVFPIIPMTVTFFTKKNSNRSKAIGQALLYGFSIIFIYTLIGTIVAKFAGAEAASFISTHWFPNLFFFVVFIIFGISFLGMFDIVLPSWIVNKVDAESDKGGLYGIFFMAFTLALVSFSCTGPIVGTILVESAGGAFIKPIAGMFAFSLALALPFTLFAIFPNWLSSLPKSGGWLNTVKVSLGFLELALALKFFSVADQVYHWRLLDREIYLALWIAIFGVLGVYLLGKIQLPHDDETKSISVPRTIFAVLVFSFVAYLIPGMFGAPLKALSGYLPPQSTHSFDLSNVSSATNVDKNTTSGGNLCEPPKYSNLFTLPHNIQGYFDYKQALECSRRLNKPVFVDFTGHGCVNCREMEANVWSHPEVLKRIKNDFITVALYVDDKTELPQSEWYTSTYDNKVKSTIGKQNTDLQITKFNNNAQPHYFLLDGDGNPLTVAPVAYDPDPQHFIDFLDAGLKKFKETNQ